MRLDKFLCDRGLGSRTDVKEMIRKKSVTVNEIIVVKPETQINEETDVIRIGQKRLVAVKNVCYLMNKPSGFVCATTDAKNQIVLDLIREEDRNRDLFPIGRLDKDTEGMLLISDNGDLAHRLMAPGKHVVKTYVAVIRKPLQKEDVRRLKEGVDIGDDKPTSPAEIIYQEGSLFVTIKIHEGRYHQVKRMLEAVSNEVVSLRRTAIGSLIMEKSLQPGEYRNLSQEEIILLSETVKETYE